MNVVGLKYFYIIILQFGLVITEIIVNGERYCGA